MRIILIIGIFLWVSCTPIYTLTIVKLPSGTSSVGILNKKNKPTFLASHYETMDASLKNDTLFVKLSYSGGCKQHEFHLYEQKSTKDTVWLGIKHQANNEACRALITEEVWFDVSPLKSKKSKLRIIQLDGYAKSLIYTY